MTSLALLGLMLAAANARGENVPVLLELFTSEGCSSCPPADALLAALDRTQPVAGADLIVLSEHVDYWNQLGWTDPFSSPAFSKRQQQYAAGFGLDSVYTPQLVVDGRAQMIGSDGAKARAEISRAVRQNKAEVRLSQVVRDAQQVKLHVEISALPGGSKGDAYVALAENQAVSQVTRGENKGRSLPHVAIVKTLLPIGAIGKDAAFAKDIAIPLGSGGGSLRVVAFVQEKKSGHIIGVAQQRLGE